MTDTRDPLAVAAQQAWDARRDAIMHAWLEADAGLSVAVAMEGADKRTIIELGPRPDLGDDTLANVLKVVVPLLTAVGLGVTLAPAAVAALKAPVAARALGLIRNGLKTLGVDPADIAQDVLSAGMKEFGMNWAKTFLSGLKGALAAIGGIVLSLAVPALIDAVFSTQVSAEIAKMPVVGTLLAGVFGGLGLAVKNWWAHRNDPKPSTVAK